MKLIPLKHLLVARDKSIYWYVGEVLGTETYGKVADMIGCGSCINQNLNQMWDEKLLAKRDVWYGEPRINDIIYVFEITDMTKWLDIFHKNSFVSYNMLQGYSNKEYTKLVYELVDRVFEENFRAV